MVHNRFYKLPQCLHRYTACNPDFIRAKFSALAWTPTSDNDLQPRPSIIRLPRYLPIETTARVFFTMFLEILEASNFCNPRR